MVGGDWLLNNHPCQMLGYEKLSLRLEGVNFDNQQGCDFLALEWFAMAATTLHQTRQEPAVELVLYWLASSKVHTETPNQGSRLHPSQSQGGKASGDFPLSSLPFMIPEFGTAASTRRLDLKRT
jgi:hypothetical protein